MSSIEAFLNHPIETLERALHIRKQIDQLNETLKALFGPTSISLAGVQTRAPKRRGRPPKATAIVTATEGHEGQNGLVKNAGKKKRKMSAEGRAKIAAAQKARWAKVKGEKTETVTAEPKTKKKKRKLSPESRARIAAAQKARWAKVKDQGAAQG